MRDRAFFTPMSMNPSGGIFFAAVDGERLGVRKWKVRDPRCAGVFGVTGGEDSESRHSGGGGDGGKEGSEMLRSDRKTRKRQNVKRAKDPKTSRVMTK